MLEEEFHIIIGCCTYITAASILICMINIINLELRHLNLYVGKERIHCFLVARPVAMFVNAVAIIRGNRGRKITVLSLSSDETPVIF